MGDLASTSGSVERSWPLVAAHRGASVTHPENTLEAFEAAIQAGADLIELDVRLTADGVAVVSHDAVVEDPAGGHHLIHEQLLADLRRVRPDIPRLEETLDLTAGRIGLDLEIKNLPDEPAFDSPRETTAHEVVNLLDDQDRADDILISSFNWLSIERVRELAPGIETGFLTPPAIDPAAALVYVRQHGHRWVLPQAYAMQSADEAFVQRAHEDGVLVGTWTVDDPDAMAVLFGTGLDLLITDDPRTAVRVRDATRAPR